MRLARWLAVLVLISGAVVPLRADDAAVSDAVQEAARVLFRTYRTRDAGFRRLVGISPRGAGFLQYGSSGGAQLANSVQRDFSNLRNIQFDTTFYGPNLDARKSTARLTVNWFRRANFDSSGEEWIVRDQSSVLVFDVTGPQPLLAFVEGDPLFGLSGTSPILVVNRGTVNGTPVTNALSVQNGRLQCPAPVRTTTRPRPRTASGLPPPCLPASAGGGLEPK